MWDPSAQAFLLPVPCVIFVLNADQVATVPCPRHLSAMRQRVTDSVFKKFQAIGPCALSKLS